MVSIEADAHGAVMTQPDPDDRAGRSGRVAAALGVAGVDGVFLARAAGNASHRGDRGRTWPTCEPDTAAIAALQRRARRRGRLRGPPTRRPRTSTCACSRPSTGIPEDPGTGAAAGPIGVLARRELGTDVDVTIHQGDLIGRPCTIEVHAEDGAIRVGGAVVACAEGRFTALSGPTMSADADVGRGDAPPRCTHARSPPRSSPAGCCSPAASALAVVDPTDGPPICPFKAVTGLDCPGCGGTRAAHQLFTGHLGAAADLNVLAVARDPARPLRRSSSSLTAMLGGPRWRAISVLVDLDRGRARGRRRLLGGAQPARSRRSTGSAPGA